MTTSEQPSDRQPHAAHVATGAADVDLLINDAAIAPAGHSIVGP